MLCLYVNYKMEKKIPILICEDVEAMKKAAPDIQRFFPDDILESFELGFEDGVVAILNPVEVMKLLK